MQNIAVKIRKKQEKNYEKYEIMKREAKILKQKERKNTL